MGFEFFKESYTGNIREITIGQGDKAFTVGGETGYPFYLFEGEMPNKPRVAMEIWDMEPTEWPDAVMAYFKDVAADPAAWAKKCVEEFGAEAIVLQLKSTDPNDKDASPEEASATVKKVLDAIDVPLIIWGSANVQKDEAVLKKIAEDHQGANLTMGPVEDANHKGIGAAAMGYGHTLISSSPIDVNLAKQVNILLENLGMPADRIVIDPTTGGLGYGLEYSYSVMERLRMAALSQGDDKLQYPVINNLANEVWKCKEAKLTVEQEPALGDPEKRAVLMEAAAAATYLLAGSDILIMRHPEAIRLAKSFVDLMIEGGMATGIEGIAKKLDVPDIDYAALAPEPDLTIAEEAKKAPAAKKAEAPKAAAPAKEAPKAEAPKAAAPAKEAPKAEAAPAEKAPEKDEAALKAEAEAKAKAEVEAKAKAEAEAKAKAAADAKAKAEAEAKAKAAAEEKAKQEALAKEKAEVEKREAEAEALRQQRAKEREELAAKRQAAPADTTVTKTAAKKQTSKLGKLAGRLGRVHRR